MRACVRVCVFEREEMNTKKSGRKNVGLKNANWPQISLVPNFSIPLLEIIKEIGKI